MGESTNTPGLTGEERRRELLRRLTQSICGEGSDDESEEEIEKKPIVGTNQVLFHDFILILFIFSPLFSPSMTCLSQSIIMKKMSLR